MRPCWLTTAVAPLCGGGFLAPQASPVRQVSSPLSPPPTGGAAWDLDSARHSSCGANSLPQSRALASGWDRVLMVLGSASVPWVLAARERASPRALGGGRQQPAGLVLQGA